MGHLKSVFYVLVMAAAVGAPLMVEAQLDIIGHILGLTRIQGAVYCTPNGNVRIDGTNTPAFPNAAVEMQCGGGNIVSTATTNNQGLFSILVDPALKILLSSLLNDCRMVVKTPLSNCNSTLASTGDLVSQLNLIGSTVQGLLTILNVVTGPFQFLPSI